MPDEGQLVPIVLIPRFTTFVGPGPTYFSNAVRVVEYTEALISVYRGPLTGTTGSVGFNFQESTDRNVWVDIQHSLDPGSNAEQQYSVTISKRWFRMGVVMGGSNTGVTCWAQGFLVKRHH